MKYPQAINFLFIGSALSLLAACGAVERALPSPTSLPAGAEETASIANPASTYCYDQGYRLEVRTAANGIQLGVCVFPDGSECEEWAFFRGDCAPQSADAVNTPDPQFARAAVLDYLHTRYAPQAPAPDLAWVEVPPEKDRPVGAGEFQYRAGNWEITVSFPLAKPHDIIYTVVVTNRATGFVWKGTVNAIGLIIEEAVSAANMQ